MARNKKAAFSSKNRIIIASRVGYCCSNPDCLEPTLTPSIDENKYNNIGEAAHIVAASDEGPRADKLVSNEERAKPENGIWLCCNCHTKIDRDPNKYTIKKLKEWKQKAEERANEKSSTFVQIGLKHIMICHHVSTRYNCFEFDIADYLLGDMRSFDEYVCSFDAEKTVDNFGVFEYTSRGYQIKKLEIQKNRRRLIIEIFEKRKSLPVKNTLSLSDCLDLEVDKNRNIKIAKGEDAAIQIIRNALVSKYDGCSGSFFPIYYLDYKDDLDLLTRLIKLEIARLAFTKLKNQNTCTLDFIEILGDVVCEEPNDAHIFSITICFDAQCSNKKKIKCTIKIPDNLSCKHIDIDRTPKKDVVFHEVAAQVIAPVLGNIIKNKILNTST